MVQTVSHLGVPWPGADCDLPTTCCAWKGRQREQGEVGLRRGPQTQKSLGSEEPGAEATIHRGICVLLYWVRKGWLYLYTGYTLCISDTHASVLPYVEFKTIFWEVAPVCLSYLFSVFDKQDKTPESYPSVLFVADVVYFFLLYELNAYGRV